MANAKSSIGYRVLAFLSGFLIVSVGSVCANAGCLEVGSEDSQLKIDPIALQAMATANINENGFYNIVKVVSRYETEGCWSGVTGDFDGQWLSAGVMQWNLGSGSLQPLLARFREKFPDTVSLDKVLTVLMPKYGKSLFDVSCRSIPLTQTCKTFLEAQYSGEDRHLTLEFADEVNALFQSTIMRQIQVDYFARSVTAALSDLVRVFQTIHPAPWQVAWAMDLKTQQGRFPTDASVKRIKTQLSQASSQQREQYLLGIVLWYDGLCQSGSVGGVVNDCSYNVTTWNAISQEGGFEIDRQQAIHFTYLVSRTASTRDGFYQADAFQRRATIAFGKGSVHGTHIAF